MTLDNYLDKVKSSGLTVGLNGELYSDELSSVIGEIGCYETRKMFAPHIEEIIDTTIRKYEAAGDNAALSVVKEINERYTNGEKLLINELLFYDPSKGEIPEISVGGNPILKTVTDSLRVYGIPAGIINRFINSRILKFIGNAATPFSYSIKFFNKFYRETKRPVKNYKKMAKYFFAGVGGTLSGIPLKSGKYTKFLIQPFTIFYNYVTNVEPRKRMMGWPIPLEMPELSIMENDLETQVKSYNTVLRKYEEKRIRRVTLEDLPESLYEVHKYLKQHLNTIKLEEIDIEIDSTPFNLLGKKAKADILTDTTEFAADVFPIQENELAWIYIHQMFHLDGISNEGKVNFRTDSVIEDMAVYLPDRGYDLLLGEMRLAAVAHAYTTTIKADVEREIKEKVRSEKRFIRPGEINRRVQVAVFNKLIDIGVEPNEIHRIWRWTFPSRVHGIIFTLQSILGGEQGTPFAVDYYKLLKRAGVYD